VANTLRLLQAAPEVRAALAAGEISEGHARALLGLDAADQPLALAEVLRRGLNVRQTEELVRRWGEQPVGEEAAGPDPELGALSAELTARLGTRVVVRQNRRGAGRLVIHFYSTEQLNELLARMQLLDLSGS
jgi:ParB family chromosome partitioning protein